MTELAALEMSPASNDDPHTDSARPDPDDPESDPAPDNFERALELITKMRHEIEVLRKEREDIEVEEQRMFEFLHGLGEALTSENAASASALHRIIVQGISMVVEASGGALYLLDKTGDRLIPTFLSESCPPLLSIPKKGRFDSMMMVIQYLT